MKTYKIGELAKIVDLSIDTIRYYEKCGLIPIPERQENEYRMYTEIYITILEFVKTCKENGFTLKEIGEIIGLIRLETRDDQLLESIVRAKMKRIDEKIQELINFKKQLQEIVDYCNDDTCSMMNLIRELES